MKKIELATKVDEASEIPPIYVVDELSNDTKRSYRDAFDIAGA